MFDKLIESNTAEAEFKPRRKFFMVSSVVVGILFITAVVASLYAHDLDLGTNDFEFAELLAPVTAAAPEPEPPRPQPQQRTEQNQQTELPSVKQLIQRIDQPPLEPPAISTTRFTGKTIPLEEFKVNPLGPETNGTGPVGPRTEGTGTSSNAEPRTEDTTPIVEHPPAPPKAEPKRSVTISKGPVNGYATYLPKPPYPPVARQINLSGTVSVQVLIDETGNVVSAKVVDGHPLFRLEAERAARQAKFRPTTLGEVPVKVTGVITYRFIK